MTDTLVADVSSMTAIYFEPRLYEIKEEFHLVSKNFRRRNIEWERLLEDVFYEQTLLENKFSRSCIRRLSSRQLKKTSKRLGRTFNLKEALSKYCHDLQKMRQDWMLENITPKGNKYAW